MTIIGNYCCQRWNWNKSLYFAPWRKHEKRNMQSSASCAWRSAAGDAVCGIEQQQLPPRLHSSLILSPAVVDSSGTPEPCGVRTEHRTSRSPADPNTDRSVGSHTGCLLWAIQEQLCRCVRLFWRRSQPVCFQASGIREKRWEETLDLFLRVRSCFIYLAMIEINALKDYLSVEIFRFLHLPLFIGNNLPVESHLHGADLY